MSTRRIEHPRVTDGSRWLGKRNGAHVVFKQVGTYWESREKPTVAYDLQIEETGEKIRVEAEVLYAEIEKKNMVEIYHYAKNDWLKAAL